ncbi:EamA family transporter [Kocuria marina]|uniref:EamA family transporter n=1 Tax=Kocuria marina TaxID=223184 RepID=UPI003F1E73E2
MGCASGRSREPGRDDRCCAHGTRPPLRARCRGLLYIAAASQFLGFVVWYRGMALMGIARASQLQLMQPLLTLVWTVLLLGEPLPDPAGRP